MANTNNQTDIEDAGDRTAALATAFGDVNLASLKSRVRKALARGTFDRVAMAAAPVITIDTTVPTSPYTNFPSGTITATSDYDPYINILGGWPKYPGTGSSIYAAVSTKTIDAATGGTSANAYSVAPIYAFNSDAPILHFRAQTNPVSRFWIKIDGEYVSLAGHVLTSTSVGYVHIDWTGVAGEGDPHIYEIEMQGASDATTSLSSVPLFGPLYVRNLDRIWPLSTEEIGPQLGVFGDSLGMGVTFGQDTVVNQHAGFAKRLGSALGLRNTWSSALNGTGYIARSSGQDAPDLQNRIGDITGWNHDIAIIAMGINDNTLAGTTVNGVTISTTTVQQRVTDILTAVRVTKPKMPIFVLGPWWRTANSATAQGYETAISDAVTAMNDVRIAFIPTVSTTWITGTGSVSSPNGTGNADRIIYDESGAKTHWVTWGHRQIAGRVFAKVLEKLDAMY